MIESYKKKVIVGGIVLFAALFAGKQAFGQSIIDNAPPDQLVPMVTFPLIYDSEVYICFSDPDYLWGNCMLAEDLIEQAIEGQRALPSI